MYRKAFGKNTTPIKTLRILKLEIEGDFLKLVKASMKNLLTLYCQLSPDCSINSVNLCQNPS